MIKLVDLLNEIDIPKNEWKPISKGELKASKKTGKLLFKLDWIEKFLGE